MQDLFENDGIAEVRHFSEIYEGYETHSELISGVEIFDIDLGPSSIDEDQADDFIVFPNPIVDRRINIKSGFPGTYSYELWSVDGRIQQQGYVTSDIPLLPHVNPGLYLLIVTSDSARGVHLILAPD
jgi:hypothetical protein